MPSFPAVPSERRPRLLVVELWGVGDVALALPFVQAAARVAQVTLLAKPSAAILARRFCPDAEVLPLSAPWTAHRGKYRLHRWPWGELSHTLETLRIRKFVAAVSARPDPRDHALMALAGADVRAGFSRAGSRVLLTDALPFPGPHRRAHWEALAERLEFDPLPVPAAKAGPARRIVIHTGAAQPTREWPRLRFKELADRLRATGREVTLLDGNSGGLEELLATLASADRFIGNDSGPGHLAALLGVPTFTLFGAQLAKNFHPVHPQAAWLDGTPCPYKPCHDYCRFDRPYCIQDVAFADVWPRLAAWLA